VGLAVVTGRNLCSQKKHVLGKLRILHIQRMAAVSGSEKYIKDLAEAQKQDGSDVAVVIVCDQQNFSKLEAFAKEIKAKGIEVFVFYSKKWFSYSIIRSLSQLCRQWKPDLLHTHLLHADVYAAVIKSFFIRSLKIVSTKHGFQETWLEQYGFAVNSKLKKMPFYWLSRLAERKIDQSFTISHAMAAFYYDSKITRQRIPVIHHGLRQEAIPEEAVLATPSSPLRIVSVGRLTRYKGFRYLLDAMAVLKEKQPAVVLEIAGNGPQREELETYCKKLGLTDNVRFLGFQPQPQKLLEKAALVVIPSTVEPFGLVFIEAMAYGKPIVAFDVPAGNEIVKDGETGFLIEPFNTSMMADRLEKILFDPVLANSLGKQGRLTLLQRFKFERVHKNVNDLYTGVLKNLKRPQ